MKYPVTSRHIRQRGYQAGLVAARPQGTQQATARTAAPLQCGTYRWTSNHETTERVDTAEYCCVLDTGLSVGIRTSTIIARVVEMAHTGQTLPLLPWPTNLNYSSSTDKNERALPKSTICRAHHPSLLAHRRSSKQQKSLHVGER